MQFTYELGFLGAGNMAEAIARAAINQGVVPAGQIIAFDPSPERRKLFTEMGVAIGADNAAVVRYARQVLIAVKPQAFDQVAADIAQNLSDGQVLISIMAGITTAKMAHAFAGAGCSVTSPRIIRVMPNTPLMVGAGMAAIARNEHTQVGDDDLTLKLFSAAGKAIRVSEDKLDAITALSGSGPAYLFYLAEAMEKAAVAMGLGEHAHLLVTQTLQGSAKLLAKSEDSPAELRRKVTSPGGTTEAAVHHLDGNASTQVIVNAIKAAQARSKELGG